MNEVLMAVILIAVGIVIVACAASYFFGKKISKPIVMLTGVSEKLALGDTDVEITNSANDEIGVLAKAFEKIVENIKQQSVAARRIAEGDFSIEITPRSDADILSNSMKTVVEELRNLVSEAQTLTKDAVAGDLSARARADQFKGGYREIMDGVNSTLDSVIEPLKMAASYVDRISKSDIPEIITQEYHGDFNEIKNNLNSCIETMNRLLAELNKMISTIQDGKFNVRGNEDAFAGDWGVLVHGVNSLVDALLLPIGIMAENINMIGKGEIPPVITDTYYGDFDEIKQNINNCITGLDGLVEGKDILQRMSSNDYTGIAKSGYSGIFAEIADSINGVADRINRTIDVLKNITIGDFKDLEYLKSIGKRSENDMLMPSMIKMIEIIKTLVEETTLLSDSAVDGKLDARGDTGKFEGEYAKVIEGINETLNAIIAPVEEASSVLKEMARGNLHIKMEGDYQGDHAELKESLNETIGNLLDISTRFQAY